MTTGAIFSYEALPDSLKSEVLVRTKVEEDPEVLAERQELVKTKKPAELAEIHGLSDFPLPQRIETLVRPGRRTLKSTKDKDMSKKRSLSWSSLTNPATMYDTLPKSLKQECLVRSKVEDPEKQKERQQLTQNKSVSELGKVTSLSDFPIPSPIEKLLNSDKRMSRPVE